MTEYCDQIVTSQIISDVIKRAPILETKSISYKVQFKSTDTEPHLAWETVKYTFEIIKTDLIHGIEENHLFTRRYSHFEWLQNELETKHIGRILPSLPEKTQNYDKDKRKYEFLYYMQKLLDHKLLRNSDVLQKFISKEFKDFNDFQEYINKLRDQNTLINRIMNTGVSFVSLFSKCVSFGSSTILPRVPDKQDLDFDEISKEIQLSKQQTEIIYSDLQKIVQKLQIQSKSLIISQEIFSKAIQYILVIECQQNDEFMKLKRITKIYENFQMHLKETFIYRLETCIRDYVQALKIINEYRELKDQIYKDSQQINNINIGKSKLEELKYTLSNNKQKVEQIYTNFLDDLPMFKQTSQLHLKDIQSNFHSELSAFYFTLKNLKQL
ncbi:unnamed protein product (macronuclear) [Paramecium tetraurelia]|uniref:PX domain-containing protein n=1 Tax=Paramecium tetraurelia TaxID=5888 RepID=A0CEJ0_PARTE|nr:uncharacterized protein GSPATT00037645001 [Paramecium tetraurelia]CAK69207.1 unnamed protein product [Paramecium tetraurelia]|eukprot:XP_001436604.1 hypothetical protein (macronuclear) [Paramecium tetraurelia strain d4-2]